MKNKRILRLLASLLIFVLAALPAMAQEALEDRLKLTEAELSAYAEVQNCVDVGDCAAFADLLLGGAVTDEVYALLLQEDEALVKIITLDAMTTLANAGEVEKLARLRMQGYVPDEWFRIHWQDLGSELPEETEEENAAVDALLVHELQQAFLRDSYAVRSFGEMYASGLLTEEMHSALVKKLGFDYTDEHYLDENNIAPLRELTADEKLLYDEIFTCIDEGDCTGVCERLLSGDAKKAVYAHLMAEDAAMTDFIIGQAMAQYARDGNMQKAVDLRMEGFVSDNAFENYWENTGAGAPAGGSKNSDYPGVDMYLLHELEQACLRDAAALELVREYWNSGRLTDELHTVLTERLGAAYSLN